MNVLSYDYIKKILFTNKTQKMLKTSNQVVFIVSKDANKLMIKEAVSSIWKDIKIKKVGIINVPGRSKRIYGKKTVVLGAHKKAIVSIVGNFTVNDVSTDLNVVDNKS